MGTTLNNNESYFSTLFLLSKTFSKGFSTSAAVGMYGVFLKLSEVHAIVMCYLVYQVEVK